MSSPPEPDRAGTPAVGGPAELVLVPERLAIRAGGHEVRITATQFRLMAVLLGEPGRVFSRAELVERGIGSRVSERTVDAHVKELRRKLGLHGARIETVRHLGYRYQGH